LSNGARILVIDDDASIRRLVSIVLGRAGYVVDTASNGEEAIAKSNVQFYNMALVDIRLPDIQGTKLLSLLRDTTPRMIKVILTGYPVLENAMEAISRGVDAYLTKPVNAETLLATVQQLFEKQLKEREFTEESLRAYLSSRFKEAKANRRGIDEATPGPRRT
jgi:two-component system response regulator PilR (NtrC family)